MGILIWGAVAVEGDFVVVLGGFFSAKDGFS